MTQAAHDLVVEHFRWVEGHADVWRLFANAEVLCEIVHGLANPWRGMGITKVIGIESRGFLLGAATAISLGAGFVAIRKHDTSLLPGPKVRITAEEDYRGKRHDLRMQSVLTEADRVLLVDDWAERGSQALASRHLVRQCGATFAGVSVIVDMLDPDVRTSLGRVTALVQAAELSP